MKALALTVTALLAVLAQSAHAQNQPGQGPLIDGRSENVWVFRDGGRVLTYHIGPAHAWTDQATLIPTAGVFWSVSDPDQSGFDALGFTPLPGDLILPNTANGLAPTIPGLRLPAISVQGVSNPVNWPWAPPASQGVDIVPAGGGPTLSTPIRVTLAPYGFPPGAFLYWSTSGGSVAALSGYGPADRPVRFTLLGLTAVQLDVMVYDEYGNDVFYDVRTFHFGSVDRYRDGDRDGLPDLVEAALGLDPMSPDANRDTDGDGFSSLEELLLDTDPNDPNSVPLDTDDDGTPDLAEIHWRLTDPYDESSRPAANGAYGVERVDTVLPLDHDDARLLGDGRFELSELGGRYLDVRDISGYRATMTGALAPPGGRTFRYAAEAPRVIAAVRVVAPNARETAAVAMTRPGLGAFTPLDAVNALSARGAVWNNLSQYKLLLRQELASRLLVGRDDPEVVNPSFATTLEVVILQSLLGWAKGPDGTLTLFGTTDLAPGFDALTQLLEVTAPHSAATDNTLLALVAAIAAEPALGGWRDQSEILFTAYLEDQSNLSTRFDHALATAVTRASNHDHGTARDLARLVARVGFERLDALGDARPLALDTSADFDFDGLPTSDELAGPAATTTDPLRADTDGDGYQDGFDPCALDPDLECCIEVVCDLDADRDGVIDSADNCPAHFNPGQADGDGDGRGDACPGAAHIVRPLGTLRVRQGTTLRFEAYTQHPANVFPYRYAFVVGAADYPGPITDISFPVVGVFAVQLYVEGFLEDENGDYQFFSDLDTRTVTVYPALPDTLSATLTAPGTLVEGEVGTFSVTPMASASSPTATWTFSDGPMANGLTVTRSFPTAGVFFATVQLTDAYQRTLTLQHRVDVTDSAPVAAFAYELDGFTLTLTDESAAFDGIASRRFSIPGTTYDSTDPVTVFHLAGPGSYLVRLDVTDGDGSTDRYEELVVVAGLTCQGGCDDGIACTVDTCDASTGQCVNTPVNCAADRDGDGVPDGSDNCPDLPNTDQANFDGDGFGDVCDLDDDNDGAPDLTDNCAFLANPGQQDVDLDGLGDACDPDIDNDGLANAADNCPFMANADQADLEGDGAGDACDPDDDNDGVDDSADNCPTVANTNQSDLDGDGDGDLCDADMDNDGHPNADDNCPNVPNPGQEDHDGDGLGNLCDADDDNDGLSDETDNCRFAYNPDQLDTDGDLQGDACDSNDDNDSWPDSADNCPLTWQADQRDTDADGRGDACDDDVDGDGFSNASDNCPVDANPDQLDTDHDQLGDACDLDDDGDGVEDPDDNCPLVANGQDDLDQDMIGDACDDDLDGDGIPNAVDNCLRVANASQLDTDDDGEGDLCDLDDDNDGTPDTEDNCPLVANDQADLDDDTIGDACDDDVDGDGIPNAEDNCLTNPNPNQANLDGDTQGDACDPDIDGDGYPNAVDNCPRLAWSSQADLDGDGQGDACDDDIDGDGVPNDFDNCVALANPQQGDLDQDGSGDACDPDRDGDGVPNAEDNCPDLANPQQQDFDGDGVGDACDAELDGDGIPDAIDNCPFDPNPDQADRDQDGSGDACDPDMDGDGVPNAFDNCALVPNPTQVDTDGDGLGDACDGDDDGDGILDGADNCPRHINPAQEDLDRDGIGDACDSDKDGDGVFDVADNCPTITNADQRDLDNDGIGDACDADKDGDGVPNGDDICPDAADPEQLDTDGDGLGDACDGDDDNDGVADANDQCPGTGLAVVDPNTGCSIEQLCPCAGPRGTTDEWRSHDKYVSCVTQAARRFARTGLITSAEQNTLIITADQSDCGYLRCNGRILAANPAATGPFLVLTVPSYRPVGQAPAAPLVYAGTTRVFPDTSGRYVVPFRGAGGAVLVDALSPSDLKSSSVPPGAIVVLRGGAGNYTLGLNGGLPSRSTLGVSVVSRVQSGQRANERDLSFERQGDGLWTLGDVRQDEFVSTPTETTLHMTEGKGHDLLSGRLCQ